MEEEIYREHILDHYKNPRNFGKPLSCSISHADSNPLCGDQVEVFIDTDAQGVITKATFNGSGCAISQAATSMLTEEVMGKTLEQVQQMGQQDIRKLLGIEIGVARIKCAMLGLRTLQKGIYSSQLVSK